MRSRIAILAASMIFMAGGIGVRLYSLQVEQNDDLRAKARKQHERHTEVWGRRGTIVDRHGRELAVSVSAYSLFAHPHRVENPAAVARALAPLLGLPAARLRSRLDSDEPFVWLRRMMDVKTANAVRGLGPAVGAGEAIDFEIEAKRLYPQGSLASHIVGFANIDQKGLEGLELAFDELLRGDPTTYLALFDGGGSSVKLPVQEPAREPQDLVLTIDTIVQHIVERELARGVRESGAAWGSAVLIEPATGHVLAMANYPSADPNAFGRSRPAHRRNRAVTDVHEPGSTFKIVTAAAALDLGRVDPDRRFDCGNGGIFVAGQHIRDSHEMGVATVRQIMEQSSNAGMIRVSDTMSAAEFRDYIERFGFGRRTGIELPGEVRGLLAPLSQWSGLSQASLSFGHEIGVTPLQLASAFATVANGGVAMAPRIVLGTRDGRGDLTPAPPVEGRRVISEQTARTLTSILEGVVVRGTGRRAQVPAYRVAGKTGTPQKLIGGRYSDEQYVASFGGYAPARAPRVAGVIVLDSPRGQAHTGGMVAAPVFGRILADVLLHLRVVPDENPLHSARSAVGAPGLAGR